MKPLLLLLIGGCAACGQGLEVPSERPTLPLNEAQASMDIPEPDGGCDGDAEGPVHDDPPHPVTGNWRLDGRSYADFFFVKMINDNRNRPQRLWIWMQNSDGRSLDLLVRPAPRGDDLDQQFQGPAWEAASTAERAALVKAAIGTLARRSAETCGTRLDLEHDLANFEPAFAELDRRQ